MHPVKFPNPFDRAAQPSRVVAVIPARYQSTRFPGKPLADIAGRSMIEHVYRRAAAANGVDAPVEPVLPALPPPPPIRLSGIAEDGPADRIERTAVLSVPAGVLLVREGDVVLGQYRVAKIEAGAVELTDASGGPAVRLTLRP